jgi:eukaryotic-like serine/threonine-protein kinase
VIGGDVARNGTLVLQGVVGRGRPEQELLHSVRDAAPTAAVDWAIGVADGPYCGALNLVRAYARPFGAGSGGMDIGLKGGKTDLVENDRVDIRTVAPDFPAYVQVDYFSSDGTVAHLRKSATGTPATAPRATVEIAGFEAAPPFGTDVVTAIAVSTPLFTREQALSEKTDDYVRELRTALDTANRRKSQVAAAAIMVKTSPKP